MLKGKLAEIVVFGDEHATLGRCQGNYVLIRCTGARVDSQADIVASSG
jgi:hypothetical protein